MGETKKFSKLEANTISSLIFPDERLIVHAAERPLHGGVLNPTVVMVTDQRTIIVNRKYLRLKSDITFIDHANVVSFRVVHGLVFSSVWIRQQGASDSEHVFIGVGEGEIRGLSRADTNAVANAISHFTRLKKKGIEHSVHEEIAVERQHETVNDRIAHMQGVALPEWKYKSSTPQPVHSMVAIQATTVPGYSTITSITPSEPARERLKAELPNEGPQVMPQAESITRNDNYQKTVIQPVNEGMPVMPQGMSITPNNNDQKTVIQPVDPDDLLIFKVRKARGEVKVQEPVSESWSGEYPTPDQILVGEKQKGKPSMFQSFFDMIKLAQ
jgi:hypothetical protein